MSDENDSGTEAPPTAPPHSGGFDWLVESHQVSAPLAPLTDDFLLPPPVSAMRPVLVAPPVQVEPPVQAAPPVDLLAWTPPRHSEQPESSVQPQPSEQPVEQVPIVPPPAPATTPAPLPVVQAVTPAPLPPVSQAPLPPSPVAQPGAFSFGAESHAPASFAGGASSLALERHDSRVRSGNGPLDWIGFVLAFLAPPIGLLVGIVAVITGLRTRGYAAGIAKAAIGIGAVLSIVLGVAYAVVTKIDTDHAAHASIVASSAAWCTKLKSTPATLTSDTYGWPAPGDTIAGSITKMQAYEAYWDGLARIAPAGIKADTLKVAATAKSIIATVQSTQTLNDSGNVAQMQNVVARSGINDWVSDFCS